ncbi:hypothetical protein C8J56DRAFT_958972 [Mycena floridula]|nr:hypothetical protein C8J56DRAFT_958972 [Mycena floridula]
MSVNSNEPEFSRPAPQIRTLDIESVPDEIFEEMKVYEDAARDFILAGFEQTTEGSTGDHVFIKHRPIDEQVAQIYRMPVDPSKPELERLTYFNVGSGRTIVDFLSIKGDDWRGSTRHGGTIMVMDLDGNEFFQLWRYWEDSQSEVVFPNIEGELDNKPGKGRIERITHDNFKYSNPVVSPTNKVLAFTSNKENGSDTLVYISKLSASNTGAAPDSKPFTLPVTLVAPSSGEGTTRWVITSMSSDDKRLLLSKTLSNAHAMMYLLDISSDTFSPPILITLRGATERLVEETTYEGYFSKDLNTPNLLYILNNAFGDFVSLVVYDTES